MKQTEWIPVSGQENYVVYCDCADERCAASITVDADRNLIAELDGFMISVCLPDDVRLCRSRETDHETN